MLSALQLSFGKKLFQVVVHLTAGGKMNSFTTSDKIAYLITFASLIVFLFAVGASYESANKKKWLWVTFASAILALLTYLKWS
jgi:hypothetical protein